MICFYESDDLIRQNVISDTSAPAKAGRMIIPSKGALINMSINIPQDINNKKSVSLMMLHVNFFLMNI